MLDFKAPDTIIKGEGGKVELKNKILAAMFLGGLATIAPQAGYPFAADEMKSIDLGSETKGWSEFPHPDAQTQAWLSSRIPGLNIQQLRVVPFDAADRMMRRAVASQATYLDLLSDPILRQGNAEVYYVPQDVLERLDGHYVSGTLPVAGTTTDGRPFLMQALVSGGGYANFLYDQPAGFSFKDGENEIKIGAAGNVSARIRGPADIELRGIAGCGCVFIFCGCADIQGMTKVSGSKMIVQTSRGPQNQDIFPIRAR